MELGLGAFSNMDRRYTRCSVIGGADYYGLVMMEKIRVCPVCGFVGYAEDAVQGWIPLAHDGATTNFPYERDGEWVIVTNGRTISVERVKKDAYDHFYPNGRWFELEDVIAWMPLPEPYKGGDEK